MTWFDPKTGTSYEELPNFVSDPAWAMEALKRCSEKGLKVILPLNPTPRQMCIAALAAHVKAMPWNFTEEMRASIEAEAASMMRDI